MTSKVLANYSMTWLTISGLFLFLGLFIGVLIWTFRKGSKDSYNKIQNLPFDEGVQQ